jgi:hypothetical protein
MHQAQAPVIDGIHCDEETAGPQNSMNFSKEPVLQRRRRNVMQHD